MAGPRVDPPGPRVDVISPDGRRGTVPVSQLQHAVETLGFREVPEETLAAEAKAREQQARLGGLSGATVAGLGSALDVPTFGGFSYLLTRDPVAKALGAPSGEALASDLAATREIHKPVAAIGTVGGMFLDPFAALGAGKGAAAKVAAEGAEGLSAARAAESVAARGARLTPKGQALETPYLADLVRDWRGAPVEGISVKDIPNPRYGGLSRDAYVEAKLAEYRANLADRGDIFRGVAPPPSGDTAVTNAFGRARAAAVAAPPEVAAVAKGALEETGAMQMGELRKLPPLRTQLGDLGRIRMANAAEESTGAMHLGDLTGEMRPYVAEGGDAALEATSIRSGALRARISEDLRAAGTVGGKGENTAARFAKLGLEPVADLSRAALAGDAAAVESLKPLAGVSDAMSANEAGIKQLLGGTAHEGGIGADATVDSVTGLRHGVPVQEGKRMGDAIADGVAAMRQGQPLKSSGSAVADQFVHGAAVGATPGMEAVAARPVANIERGLMANPVTRKGLRDMAGTMVQGAAYGAGANISEQSLHHPSHISGEEILYGALMGAGVGLFAELGIRGISSVAARASSTTGTGVVGEGLAKYLRNAESANGVKLLFGNHITRGEVEAMGGASSIWGRAKKLFGINPTNVAENANFASTKFQGRAAEVLAQAKAKHEELLLHLDKAATAQPMASDLMRIIDDRVSLIGQSPLRRAEQVPVLAAEKKEIADFLGIGYDAKSGKLLGDQPITYKDLAGHIDKWEARARAGSIGRESMGDAYLDLRDDAQKLMDAKAHDALSGSGGKLKAEFANARADLEVAKKVDEAIRRSMASTFQKQGGTINALEGGILGNALGAASGGHATPFFLGNLIGRVGRKVWQAYGGPISVAFWGKAAQLGAIDTGAQVASQRLGAEVKAALDGSMKAAPKVFDAEATIASAETLASLTPDEITRKGSELGQLIAADAPDTAAHLTMVAVNAVGYLRSNMPSPLPIPFQSAHDKPVYAREGLVRFHDRLEVVEEPHMLLHRIADGTVTKEQAQAVRDTHSVFYEQTRNAVRDFIMGMDSKVSYAQRYRLGWVFDIPADPFLDPGMVVHLDSARHTVQVMQEQEANQPKPGSLRMPFRPEQIMPPPTSTTFGGNSP